MIPEALILPCLLGVGSVGKGLGQMAQDRMALAGGHYYSISGCLCLSFPENFMTGLYEP